MRKKINVLIQAQPCINTLIYFTQDCAQIINNYNIHDFMKMTLN